MSSSSRCPFESAGSETASSCVSACAEAPGRRSRALGSSIARRDTGATRKSGALAPRGRVGEDLVVGRDQRRSPETPSGRTAGSAPRARASRAFPGRHGRRARRRSRGVAVHEDDDRLDVERRCPEGEGDAVARVLPDPLLRREHAGEELGASARSPVSAGSSSQPERASEGSSSRTRTSPGSGR